MPPMSRHINTGLGNEGEQIAADYMIAQGYRIVCRNYRKRGGEIDLVCEKHNVIVFIEVKTRSSLDFGSGAESVTTRKQSRIRKLALEYIHDSSSPGEELRFDVISILMKPGYTPEIDHIISAF